MDFGVWRAIILLWQLELAPALTSVKDGMRPGVAILLHQNRLELGGLRQVEH